MLEVLADELIKEYGKSYSKRNLQYFRKFYLAFPDEQSVFEKISAFVEKFKGVGGTI